MFAVCCSDGETCVNGSCCSTPNADATECCAYGVGTNGACCTTNPATCSNGTTTDTNGCQVCETGCTDDKPVSCQSGSDTWCCAEGNTCGTTTGQCCAGGTCCEGITYCTEGMSTTSTGDDCWGSYACCNEGTIFCLIGESPTSTGTDCWGWQRGCCVPGGTYYSVYVNGSSGFWDCCEPGGTVYVSFCSVEQDASTMEECISYLPYGDGYNGCCPAGKTVSEPYYDGAWHRDCT